MSCSGGYTFHNSEVEPDTVSLASTASERELKLKLMENYVSPELREETGDRETKKKHKKTNSLKRIFSKKGK